MLYAIRNDEKNFYNGSEYIFQGEKFANFSRENYKVYKSLKICEKVYNRLIKQCSNVNAGFNSNIEIIEVKEDE